MKTKKKLVKISNKDKATLTGNIKHLTKDVEVICRAPACFCHCACWDKEQDFSDLDSTKK